MRVSYKHVHFVNMGYVLNEKCPAPKYVAFQGAKPILRSVSQLSQETEPSTCCFLPLAAVAQWWSRPRIFQAPAFQRSISNVAGQES